MKRIGNILLNLLVWSALIAYLVWATRHCSRREQEVPAGEIRVSILDSAQLRAVNPEMVKAWIAEKNLIPLNSTAGEIPVGKIEQLLESQYFVQAAEAYVDMQGVTHIRLTQRHPLLRLRTAGYDCYLSADGYVLPLQPHLAMRLPVVTGNWTPPFEQGYAGPLDAGAKNLIFLRKLINFVEFVHSHDFWDGFIEQIHLAGAHVELVPRSGGHIVVLGSLDDYRAKLEKLLAFYRGALPYEGWESYKKVDLSYKDQIVCTK